MTKESQVIEGNKLIVLSGFGKQADLDLLLKDMTYDKTQGDDFHENELATLRQFKYHSSWDWLMPVVQEVKKKIKDADWGTSTEKEAKSRVAPILNEISNINIKNAHYCLVKFIEWYNNKNIGYSHNEGWDISDMH